MTGDPMKKRKIKIFSPDEIRTIRNFFHLTRAEFADLFFLTDETIKGWEIGRRNPSGPAIRILLDLEDEMKAEIERTERHRAAGRARLVKENLEVSQ